MSFDLLSLPSIPNPPVKFLQLSRPLDHFSLTNQILLPLFIHHDFSAGFPSAPTMATLFTTSYSSSSWTLRKNTRSTFSSHSEYPFREKSHLSLARLSTHRPNTRLKSSIKDDQDNLDNKPSSPSSMTLVSDESKKHDDDMKRRDFSVENESGEGGDDAEESPKEQEIDWKEDEEFKKFMGNPSIEAAVKLEKKRADIKLKELDMEASSNPVVGFFNRVARNNLTREQRRLEKAEETFKALDLNKVLYFLSLVELYIYSSIIPLSD